MCSAGVPCQRWAQDQLDALHREVPADLGELDVGADLDGGFHATDVRDEYVVARLQSHGLFWCGQMQFVLSLDPPVRVRQVGRVPIGAVIGATEVASTEHRDAVLDGEGAEQFGQWLGESWEHFAIGGGEVVHGQFGGLWVRREEAGCAQLWEHHEFCAVGHR